MKKYVFLLLVLILVAIPVFADAPGIQVTSLKWTCQGPIQPGSSYNWYIVTGDLCNTGGNDYDSVTLEFSVIDRNDGGNKLSKTPACTINNVRPGDKVRFKCNNDALCCTGADMRKNRYVARLDRVKGRIARTD